MVILDVMMPVLDGFQVCERIRQQDEAVPVLFLTAKGDMVDKRIGYSVGADDYLVKPFSGDELRLRVGALLRRARSGELACAPNGVDTPRNEELAIGELSVNVHTGVTCVPERKWSSRRMRHASWPCSRTIRVTYIARPISFARFGGRNISNLPLAFRCMCAVFARK